MRKRSPRNWEGYGITVEHASRDKVYRQNASGVIRTHRRNVAIIPWKHYCGNARNRLGRFWCDWYGRTTVAYRCAITIETSVGRELPSKSPLVHITSEIRRLSVALSNTTRDTSAMLAIHVRRRPVFKVWLLLWKIANGEMGKMIDVDLSKNKFARFSSLSSDDSHRSGVTQHCVNIVFVQCIWCNAHYGDCSIRENVHHISSYNFFCSHTSTDCNDFNLIPYYKL